MEFIFLGTSSGTPTKTRNVSGLAVLTGAGKAWYLVDCGEATQHQLLNTKLSFQYLRAIFITHVHGDHCYGLPGLLASGGLAKRTQPLTIIAPLGIQRFIQATIENTDLHLSYELNFIDVEKIAQTPWVDRNFSIQAHALSHRVPSYAYSFTQTWRDQVLDVKGLNALSLAPGPLWKMLKDGEDVMLPTGQTIKSCDYVTTECIHQKIVVGGDNDTPDLLVKACQHADVLIHEATYTHAILDKVGFRHQHSSAAMVAQFAQTAKLANLILTHFSPRYQDDISLPVNINDIDVEAKKYYQGNLYLAEDFAHYHLNKRKELLRY